MARPAAIAGDWGTSNLRLFLCDEGGAALAHKAGPGAAEVDVPYAPLLRNLTADWRRAHGDLPIMLCGMVGSSIGWTQVPYVPCPASADQIAAGCVALEQDSVHIAPGLACTNRLGAPDVMRGEETQIVGTLQLDAALRRGDRLLCLPGTHTKWVTINDGVIADFLTAPAGEIYSLLTRHSVLASDRRTPQDSPAVRNDAAFARGLEQVRKFPEADTLQRVFQCRSRRMQDDLAPQDAAEFLSGLLVGSDVQGALRLWARRDKATVEVIGAPNLAHRYAQALAALGATAREIDGEAAALAGLMHIHRTMEL